MKNALKLKIRYWFEFLKQAHLSRDPIVAENIRKSSEFYAPWGNYRSVKFEDWWREHSFLFRDENADVLTSPKVGEVVTEDAFFVRIPFTYAPTTVGKIVARKYREALELRRPRNQKIIKVYGGEFRLDREDYPVAKFKNYLIFVREVYIPIMRDTPRIGTAGFVERSRKVFRKIANKSSTDNQVPFSNEQSSDESDARKVRRYRLIAEKLLRNVASGVFPGDYETTPKRTQAQIRDDRAAMAATLGPKAKRAPRHGSVAIAKKSRSQDDLFSPRKTRSDKGKRRGAYSRPEGEV
jgi:hypothetical protein